MGLTGMAGPDVFGDWSAVSAGVAGRWWHDHPQRLPAFPSNLTSLNNPPNGELFIVDPQCPLAGGMPAGPLKFYSEEYPMVWTRRTRMGKGGEIVATLGPAHPDLATIIKYEQGAELYGSFGRSPSFRIGWPAYHWQYGQEPDCSEMTRQVFMCGRLH